MNASTVKHEASPGHLFIHRLLCRARLAGVGVGADENAVKRFLAKALLFASVLCEVTAALFRLAYDIVTWELPKDDRDPFERWADSDGRGPLASLKRGGSGMLE